MDARGRRSTASNARSRHDSPRGRTKDKTHNVSGSLTKSCPGQTRSGAEGEGEMKSAGRVWTPYEDERIRVLASSGASPGPKTGRPVEDRSGQAEGEGEM